ncbi:MAG TPA: hypothetical protein GYA10_06705 [Alphaproteobacteria bacterium]|nr:hypothetical protein [Alphaproteobacteria bacterium]
MSSAFVREGGGRPQVFGSRESAESAAEMQRAMDGRNYDFEVRERERGGYMVARLNKDGRFDSWVEE